MSNTLPPAPRRTLFGSAERLSATWGVVRVYAFSLLLSTPLPALSEVKDLAGTWAYAVAEKPARLPAAFSDRIELPGTTVTRRKGAEVKEGNPNGWGDAHTSPEQAWYQREIEIPAHWADKRVTLVLERTRASRVWLGEREIDSLAQTLSSPHLYDLSGVAPGPHRLSILIDAAARPPIKAGHETVLQGAWNGIIGRIELQVRDPVWIERVRLTPDLAANVTHAAVTIGNRTGKAQAGAVSLSARSFNSAPQHQTDTASAGFSISAVGGTVNVDLPMGRNAPRWDEFNPALFELTAELKAGEYADAKKERFGYREFTRDGRRLRVNGRPVFLRGTHDGAVWPITGHPPMKVEGWRRYFTQLKAWGFNHVRFHSCCPPAAAFELADELGLYLQPEVHWFGVNPNTREQEDYGLMVARQLADLYGNHASFCLITFGNEGRGGSLETMTRMMNAAKAYDPRHLWSNITNNQSDWGYTPHDDFFASYGSRRPDGTSRPARGANSYPEAAARGSHITFGPPDTLADFREAVADTPVPMISHETGQFQVFPNFDEIAKYTGAKRAFNFEHLRGRLDATGMGDQWRDFFRASARLAAVNYREDIEASLRTPQFGGFQLLDIKDYPGQGTALVGLWDVFLDNKGAITPERWREFCSETVPLLRFGKYTWTNAETFRAKMQVAHYGPADWSGDIRWTLQEGGGRVLKTGSLGRRPLRTGEVNEIGALEIPLADVSAPARVEVVVELAGTPYRNRWPLWVYPARISVEVPGTVMLARQFDADVRAALAAGGRVLLYPRAEDLPNTVKGLFQSDYWCFSMFNRHAVWRGGTRLPPGTLGMLTDPQHPIFRSFPTEFHSDYQWWHIIDQARVMVLDQTPAGYRPIVQVIDNVTRNHKLGFLWEAKVGRGRLLVCSSPLPELAGRFAEARQLHRAMLDYVDSAAFQPRDEFRLELLERLLLPLRHKARGAGASVSTRPDESFAASRAVDGRLDTYWVADPNAPAVGFETVVEGRLITAVEKGKRSEWLRLDFDRPTDVSKLRLHWLSDVLYQYRVEGSTDGQAWLVLSDQSRNNLRQITHELDVRAAGLRSLRVVCNSSALGPPGLREVEVR